MGLTTVVALLCLAQSPPASDVVSMNRRNFAIPIEIKDPNRRAEIKQLILYVSADEGKEWNQVAVATSDKASFPFTAPKDGLYWFTVGVVDQQGKQQPLSPYQVPPAQKVLVDTEKPIVKITSAERQGDDVVVAWEIQEDNPDLASLKMEYRPADGQSSFGSWYMVPVNTPALHGEARFKASTQGPLAVRLELKDRADNLGTAQKEIAAGAAPVTTAALTGAVPVTGAATSTGAGGTGNPTTLVTPAASGEPGGVSPRTGTTTAVPGSERPPSVPPNPIGRNEAWPVPDQQRPAAVPVDQRPNYGTAPTPGYPPTGMVGSDGTRVIAYTPDATAVPATGAAPANPPMPYGPLPPLQVVNDAQITLEYEVTQYGPSGVSKVELWITKDDGRTWQYLTDDPDCKSPITATLPGEGVYGLRLVLQSGLGLTKGPLLSGELPDLRIEVDTTPPLVKLFEPRPDAQRRDTLIIGWSASDRNLAAKPITLEWAERPEGPWAPIAVDLPNSGSYSWQLPPKIPYRVYLRASALDNAGNRSTAETRESIPVDLTKPAGRILGIASGARRQ